MTSSTTTLSSLERPWPARVRFLLSAALLWAGLHFLVGTTVPRGLERPATLAAAEHPLPAALALAAVLWVGSAAAAWLTRGDSRTAPLAAVALGLGLWPIGAGTMDDWLLFAAPGGKVGPPVGAVYWPLVGEYVYYLVLMVVAAGIVAAVAPADRGAPARDLKSLWLREFGLGSPAGARRIGLLALALNTVIVGVLMILLTGPAVGHTYRGQVYFAAAVSSAAAVFVVTRLLRVYEPIWHWPAPILAGLVGMLVAALRPTLLIPAAYHNLNTIPAWGLARALPCELVGVGVLASLWSLRASHLAARLAKQA